MSNLTEPMVVSPDVAKGLCRCAQVKDLDMGVDPGLSAGLDVIIGSL